MSITGAEPRNVVTGVPFDTFLKYFAETWKVGQHMALIAPTDSGKTTFAVPILKLRKYVLAIDPKGGDSRLALSGFQRISSWPPPKEILDKMAEDAERPPSERRPVRLVVTYPIRNRADRKRLRDLCSKALEGAHDMGGWTVYIDEFQVAADARMMGLAVQIEELLISARDPKRMTIVTAYQAPAWVPKASTRQAQWFVVWKTNDVDVIKSLAEKMGRDWRELLAAVRAIDRHWVLVGGTNTEDSLILAQAPRLD